jgi:hypothetical protein
MPERDSHLSDQATAVLEMIAAGSSYEQILSAYPHLTYMCIFDAAREALDLSVIGSEPQKPAYRVADIRTKHARAYERWTEADDDHLRRYIQAGQTVAQIAHRLQRQRSAIRSRIAKLNLVDQLSPHEQSELHRISALDPKEPADEQDE